MNRALLLFASAALAFDACAEDLYRWVDASGLVHFGDRPPAEARAESLEGKLKPVNSAEPTRQQDFPDTERSREIERQYVASRAYQQSRNLQQLQTACNYARRQLQKLQGRVYFVDAEGNESTVSERQRQIEADKLEARIRQRCG